MMDLLPLEREKPHKQLAFGPSDLVWTPEFVSRKLAPKVWWNFGKVTCDGEQFNRGADFLEGSAAPHM